MDSINTQWLTKAMNFHGQQLQKLWEGEYGEHDLGRRNVRDLNYQVYGQRQKHLSFQDRGKRLKLQQFIVKNADVIFSTDGMVGGHSSAPSPASITEDMYAIMPPFETYINVDRSKRLQYFTENVKVGDLILGTIVSKQQSGMMLKVLCTAGIGANVRYVADINVKAFCPVANIIPAVDKKGVTRSYMMNDYVCCEVLEVIADTDKMVCSMKGTTRQPSDPPFQPPLGLISTDDFPLVYKKALDHKNESYESLLEKSIGFNNPNNIQFLSELMGINGHCSLMKGLRGKFPDNEYASELRQVQASKWAYRNVADGIDHFKAGKHIEAFQCLNKALSIDPKNVEGLVARGALYANSGNFQKAIEDFETALKLNPNHANARKYMGETLVALGRSYEEENKIEDAKKAYQSCLSIIPYHEEAKNSLEFLKNKSQGPKNLIEPEELMLPSIGVNTNITKPADVNDALKQLLKTEEDDKKDKKKKKKSKKRKSHKHSSSSSSSSSSGSGDSSSSSSSSSSDSSSSSGDSDFKKRKKHRSRSHRREKQSSLSPLSKRMAMMDQSQDTTSNYNFNKPAQSYDFGFEQNNEPSKISSGVAELDEDRIRSFLKETADDSDYEEKVRKFLEESAKWKKSKSDDKKKKKKKDKKSKKESKKKKKEKKLKRKAAAAAAAAAATFDLSELDDNKKLRDAIKKELSKEKRSKKHHEDEDEYFLQKSGYTKRFIDSLPDLEELESKLNAYYAREKESRREFSESPKRPIMESPSPTREQKARQAVAEAAASAGKWKMQMAPGPSGNSRFKKKQLDRSQSSDIWDEKPHFPTGNSSNRNDNYDDKRAPQPQPSDKGVSVRKQMAMKEAPPLPPSKKPESPKRSNKLPPEPPKPNINTGQVVLDKFGNFRLMTPPELKKGGPGGGAGGSMSHDNVPLPPGAPPRGINAGRRPPEPPGRPRSNSRSPRRRSRSRSKFSRSRSTSMSRSRSRSYRSRSYYSRSRSRSGSYYSRSRSRSRSYSGDRRRFRRGGGGFRGGRYNDRGTYYKPRFQNPRHNNQRPRGGGNYNNRDSRYDNRDYRGGRRGPFQNRGGRRQRGRFQRGGYRDFRDRRFDRSRSRDRSRSFSGSRDSGEDTRRHHDRDKDKINKYADNTDMDPQIRHEGPLSEGEDRDDYTSNDKMVNRDSYDGKWKENDKERNGDKEGGNEENSVKNSIPSETNIEEMDKFLDKVKKDKKKEMMERNKDLLENKS